MKVALIHDWLVTFAGAEKVLQAIAEIFPEADIFSVIDFLPEKDRAWLGGRAVTTTFIQGLPKAKTGYQKYLPLMPFAIEQLNLSSYNLIISSSHAVAKGVITGPDQLHICYCHTPIRYAWDMQNQYLSESGLDSGLRSLLVRYMLFRMRNWDFRSANGVDYFISNSDYIGRRIQKVYRRNSTTIYPNVAIDDFRASHRKEDFYLTASRLVPYKKVDLIVRAFSLHPERKLVVIGDGPQITKIIRSAGPNVSILGHQPFDVLRDHMQRARAFIFASEEDFGITPVEAQACGTPVIAFGRGGALETIIGGKTGVFFEEQTERSLNDAVDFFEKNFRVDPDSIRRNSERFSKERFQSELRSFVDQCIQVHPLCSQPCEIPGIHAATGIEGALTRQDSRESRIQPI